MSRESHALAILGPELYSRLAEARVLLVGAGGIGCELLKNVVLTGFGHITLLDLDTIDLSNLNRQFLFRKKDVKKSKAMVAAKTAAAFNPSVQIMPMHANIKEPQFDVSWFKQFDIVLNALDNLDARRHVNKMCLAADVPIVESGTAGYFGQVQPLLKDRTECFDCLPKETPKTFPVCTIRSTPSLPIHCTVWAKSYLMPQLFGEEEDETELDDAERHGENAIEIANLRKQAQAFKSVRQALRSGQLDAGAAKTAFQKVYDSDIRNLLIMKDMWRTREPPVPLDHDAIMDGSFFLRGEPSGRHTQTNGHTVNGASSSSSSGASLRDQKTLSLYDNLSLFTDSTNRLSTRLQQGEDTISFDKDDDDALDFVTAASNLRSAAYGIAAKTRWEVKEMAGNIIPAIATTNAIVSGLIVLQALHILRREFSRVKNVFLQVKSTAPLGTTNIVSPNPACAVCRDVYAEVRCDPARTTLGDVVRGVLGDSEREVSVYEGARALSDPDWEDNFARTLESLGCTRGKFLSIVDEDSELATIALALAPLPADTPPDGPAFILPSPLPRPDKKAKLPPPPPVEAPTTPAKRARPSDDVDGEPASKRAKTNGQSVASSPSKGRVKEENGVILIDEEEDVILLDD